METPSLFVLGDSISIQYGPHLERMLGGSFAYSRKTASPESDEMDAIRGANGGDSSMALAYLRWRKEQGGFSPDLLLINCGLHDIKTDRETGAKQVPPEAYRENLRAIFDLTEELVGCVIWVRTTPVDDATHAMKCKDFLRFEADVQEYNRIADEVLDEVALPSIDLHGFTSRLFGPDELYMDHVHFREPVRQLQAAYIAGCLQTLAAM